MEKVYASLPMIISVPQGVAFSNSGKEGVSLIGGLSGLHLALMMVSVINHTGQLFDNSR
jgi:hypothetical protein